MTENYYKPCKNFYECSDLINKYYMTEQYEKCFKGHLKLAEDGYPLAECQVGYFYYDGVGIDKDMEKSFYWTKRAAEHGDRDAQYNLAELFYEAGIVIEPDMEMAKEWYIKAAMQGQTEAQERCRVLGITYN